MDRNSVEARAFIARRNANDAAAKMLVKVIDNQPYELSEPFISRVKAGLEGIPEEDVYASVLESACGLNPDTSRRDEVIADDYISLCVRRLDNAVFESNPFLTDIKVPESSRGDWSLEKLTYKPYEPFPLGQILLDTEYFKEVPLIGYFPKSFSCPVLKQGGREWMAIKPSEILTVEEPIADATGNVVVFGLGIGYFTYMVSRKPDVSSVTVVEIDQSAIDLFKEHILPQFPAKDRIRVVKADAFEYARTSLPSQKADFAFVDLWHDPSDGVSMYLRFKALECLNPSIRFEYWIEPLLLSNLRWQNFDRLLEKALDAEDFRRLNEADLLSGDVLP